MAPPLRARLRRIIPGALLDQSGVALIVALGVLGVLTIVGSTVVYYANTHYGSSARSAADAKAYALAEAGMNYGRSFLFNAPDPRAPDAVPAGSLEQNGGTVTYSGTLSGSTWTLVGTGTVPSPTGAAPITRTVSSKVAITTGQQGTANNAIWNYLYADDLSTCTTFSNNITVDIPLYVRGNLCMSNSALVTGSRVQVGGTVSLYNSASIGTAAAPIPEAHVAGGCRLSGGPLHSPCSAADRVYAQTITTAPTGLAKPAVDLAGWYLNAQPGPQRNCTLGSFPGGFDNDGFLNRSRAFVNLTPGTPYDCRVTDGAGNVVGQLTWTPGLGSNPGTLVVNGTIFFDGNIASWGNQYAVYRGRATIYTSGTITFSNNARLCGTAACDATWNANENLLALVAGSSTDQFGFSMSNNTKFQGAVYVVNDYLESNNALVWGPIIARQLYLSNSGQNHYVPFGTLLPGMPASYEEVTVLANVEESFSN